MFGAQACTNPSGTASGGMCRKLGRVCCRPPDFNEFAINPDGKVGSQKRPVSTCAKCAGHSFELALFTPLGTSHKRDGSVLRLRRANRHSGPCNDTPDLRAEEPDRCHRRAAQPDCESTSGLIRPGRPRPRIGRLLMSGSRPLATELRTRLERAISAATFGSVFVRKCVAPKRIFIVPNGCSTVSRPTRTARDASRRCCTTSSRCSCSHRGIRRSGPVGALRLKRTLLTGCTLAACRPPRS
jgi:hypothetical protein